MTQQVAASEFEPLAPASLLLTITILFYFFSLHVIAIPVMGIFTDWIVLSQDL